MHARITIQKYTPIAGINVVTFIAVSSLFSIEDNNSFHRCTEKNTEKRRAWLIILWPLTAAAATVQTQCISVCTLHSFHYFIARKITHGVSHSIPMQFLNSFHFVQCPALFLIFFILSSVAFILFVFNFFFALCFVFIYNLS